MLETKEKKDGNDKVLAHLFSEEKKSGYCDTLGFIQSMQNTVTKAYPTITRTPFKVLKQNLIHMLPQTICICMARNIILALIIIE